MADQKEWEQRSLMSGTSLTKLKQALNTFQTDVGPGQYEAPVLTGSNVQISQKQNVPAFSVGLPRQPNVVNPETRNTISSPHKTPAGATYSVPPDSIYYN